MVSKTFMFTPIMGKIPNLTHIFQIWLKPQNPLYEIGDHEIALRPCQFTIWAVTKGLGPLFFAVYRGTNQWHRDLNRPWNKDATKPISISRNVMPGLNVAVAQFEIWKASRFFKGTSFGPILDLFRASFSPKQHKLAILSPLILGSSAPDALFFTMFKFMDFFSYVSHWINYQIIDYTFQISQISWNTSVASHFLMQDFFHHTFVVGASLNEALILEDSGRPSEGDTLDLPPTQYQSSFSTLLLSFSRSWRCMVSVIVHQAKWKKRIKQTQYQSSSGSLHF